MSPFDHRFKRSPRPMSIQTYAAVQSFPRNDRGCDYVVGDVHGCFSQLQRRLDALRFDPDCDRLFSVGDLIDRGPESRQARWWLRQPWFHPCLGNHEAMLLSLGEDWREHPEWLLFNGGEWWYELDDEQRGRFLEPLRALPYALEVTTPWGRVGIVHADVSPELSWPRFVAALNGGDAHARATAIWSRSRADGYVGGDVQGIERVVCGHTINPDAQVLIRGNVWFIDTGAFLEPHGDHLTVLGLHELFANQTQDRGAG